MAQSAMISKVMVFVIATARLVHMRKTGSYAQDWFICVSGISMTMYQVQQNVCELIVTSQTSPTKRSKRGRVATTLNTLVTAAGRLVASATSRVMHTSCMRDKWKWVSYVSPVVHLM